LTADSVSVKLRFVGRQHEAENVSSFFFEPERPFVYQAGQYLRITLPHSNPDKRGVARTFTLSSYPQEPLLTITTRLSTPSSSFKAAIARLPSGEMLEASGPFGKFVYTQTDVPTVFIAGGIGITPFRSILGDLAARHVNACVTLLYSNRTSDIPFRSFLDSLVSRLPGLSVMYTVTRPAEDWSGPRGRIDAGFLERHVPDLKHSHFLVSGPTSLVEGIRGVLSELGIDEGRIKHESFPGYEQMSG
jgi:ferredoxin-NADP reductase